MLESSPILVELLVSKFKSCISSPQYLVSSPGKMRVGVGLVKAPRKAVHISCHDFRTQTELRIVPKVVKADTDNIGKCVTMMMCENHVVVLRYIRIIIWNFFCSLVHTIKVVLL